MNDLFHSFKEPTRTKELRPYQQDAIAKVRQSLVRKNRKIVVQLPTGAGKTLTAAKIIEGALAKGNRVIFTAPAVSLIDQTVEAFEAEGITDIGVMQADHPRTDARARVQVASVQTLNNRDIPEAAVVIVDECHIRAAAIDKLMDQRPDAAFIGLSATPWRRGMGRKWDDLVIGTTMADLIAHGYLSPFRVFAADHPDLSKVKTVAGEFHGGDLAEVMSDRKLTADIVTTWLARGENRPTLLFAVNCDAAQDLHKQFTAAGVASAYVDANTDRVERQRIERQFRSGEVRVACSVRTLTTGVDWPVACIIDAAPTKSEMLHVQKIGRGLRITEGWDDCLILDHADNTLRLGFVTDIRHDKLSTGKEPKAASGVKPDRLPRECRSCGAVVASGVERCECGREMPKRQIKPVEVADGDLVEMTRAKVPTKAEKQRFWSMALWLAAQRGYKVGWASNFYRGKMGVWPRGLDDDLVPADAAFMNYEKSRRIAFIKAKGVRA